MVTNGTLVWYSLDDAVNDGGKTEEVGDEDEEIDEGGCLSRPPGLDGRDAVLHDAHLQSRKEELQSSNQNRCKLHEIIFCGFQMFFKFVM